MFNKSLVGGLVAALLTQAAVAQDAQSVIAKASHAIGADAVKSLQYSATGFDYAFGQSPNPSAGMRSSPSISKTTSRCSRAAK